ncbi:DUF3050 domain-containing protein [Ectothiorhodospiraceae bacterium 2226]|nr:DUF3050 domain-containing protein [Ectothiorhodospiraceae bacterium 2226]
MPTFNVEGIRALRTRLDQHPVYAAVRSLEDLRCFMEQHVYSVWDFMSLIKYLQHQVAPARWPWTPGSDPAVQRFINELVLEEESDQGAPGTPDQAGFSSHFELYLGAMREVGADTAGARAFVERVRAQGLRAALEHPSVPPASRRFTATTFDFIEADKPHMVAAALALGREHVIPNMFRAFLREMAVQERQAPTFHYYLQRHVHLDEDFHAPLSLRLLEHLCEGDAQRLAEAEAAAARAIEARLEFWDGVLRALPSSR